MSKAENIVTSVVVEIDAPAELVWEILVDLAQYHRWNPFTVAVESSLQLGTPVNLYIPDPAKPGARFCVVEHLVAYEPNQLLSWEQRPTADSKDAARRDQYIESLGAERCRYFTTDIFLGLNADNIMQTFGPWVKQNFDAVANGLKQHAEALHAAGKAVNR